jgi:RHS repeat-associated protein
LNQLSIFSNPMQLSLQNNGSNHKTCAEEYRFGFNGKEKDNETFGDGNIYDYGFRVYDPRKAKFLSVDPLTKSYPWYTPYQFAGNKPIIAIDLDGLEELIVTKTTFYVGNAKVTKIDVTYVNPANRKINPNHPELGTGGVDYRLANGTIDRMPTLEPGSPEEKVMNKPMTYVVNGQIKTGKRIQALGKGTGEITTPVYAAEHLWVVETATYPNQNGNAQLNDDGINYIVEQMNSIPAFNAEVIGSTDKDPMNKYITPNDPDGNNRLSLERANDVKKEIINKGISPTRITASGAGSVGADKTKKNPADRKVTTTLYGKRN